MRLNFYTLPVRDGSWKFAVKKEKYRSVRETVDTLLRTRGLFPIFEEGQWAIVTLVGEGLREQVNEIGPRVKELLNAMGIDVEGEICDQLSYSVLVHESKRQETILALHDAFITTTT